MTVIVWDGKTLAADREAGTQYIKMTLTRKIHRLPGGRLVGLAGDASVSREMYQWIVDGSNPNEFPAQCRPGASHSCRAMVISPASEILVYEYGPHPINFLGPTHAIGAGTDAALAVMVMGGDAARAVEVASIVCNGVGGGIDTLALEIDAAAIRGKGG